MSTKEPNKLWKVDETILREAENGETFRTLVRLRCKDSSVIEAHKVALQKASSYFNDLIEKSPTVDLEVPFCSEVMDIILKFIYDFKDINITVTNIVQLFSAAKTFQLTALVDELRWLLLTQMDSYLESPKFLTDDSVEDVCQLDDILRDARLQCDRSLLSSKLAVWCASKGDGALLAAKLFESVDQRATVPTQKASLLAVDGACEPIPPKSSSAERQIFVVNFSDNSNWLEIDFDEPNETALGNENLKMEIAFASSVFIKNSEVYISDHKGKLKVFDLKSGELLHEVAFQEAGTTSPAKLSVSNGKLFIYIYYNDENKTVFEIGSRQENFKLKKFIEASSRFVDVAVINPNLADAEIAYSCKKSSIDGFLIRSQKRKSKPKPLFGVDFGSELIGYHDGNFILFDHSKLKVVVVNSDRKYEIAIRRDLHVIEAVCHGELVYINTDASSPFENKYLVLVVDTTDESLTEIRLPASRQFEKKFRYGLVRRINDC